MINKGIVKTFRAIFLHLPAGLIARQLQISEDEMRRIINAPQKYPFAIFFRIGEIVKVTEWEMLRLIYTQAMEEHKAELDKYYTDLLKRREQRLKKKRKKKVNKKSAS